MDSRRRIRKHHRLIDQANAFGIVVWIADISEIHVVEVLVAKEFIFGEVPKALHLLSITA